MVIEVSRKEIPGLLLCVLEVSVRYLSVDSVLLLYRMKVPLMFIQIPFDYLARDKRSCLIK